MKPYTRTFSPTSPMHWQESIQESNFKPINSSSSSTRIGSVRKIHPNFESLTHHEKIHLSGLRSPASVTHLNSLSPQFDHPSSLNVSSVGVLVPKVTKKVVRCGHETSIIMKPSKPHVEAFRLGLETKPPLQIIQHVKTGVKHPKVQTGNSSPSICRNDSGGYYAVT
jgi:hypothetical protein